MLLLAGKLQEMALVMTRPYGGRGILWEGWDEGALHTELYCMYLHTGAVLELTQGDATFELETKSSEFS